MSFSQVKGFEGIHYYPFGLTMAGISSKAAGNIDNKKEYQFYELNTDFDINLYESFYRSHDPQIGRFCQIDPNPVIDMEGLYASMGNNPISNIDILGDVTHYYNTRGELIRSIDDGNKSATINVIPDGDLYSFILILLTMDKAQEALKDTKYAFSNEVKSKILNDHFGVKYDDKEIEKYYDKHSKDYNENDYYKPIDGKGKLVNEHMAGMELKNGYLRVMDKKGKDDYKYNSPINSSTSEIGNADIHSHSSEGRSLTMGGESGHIKTGKGAFYTKQGKLGTDLSRTQYLADNGKGIFNVVVSPTHIYLYKAGEIIISVDRNGVPSKNPGEIK